MKHKKIRTTTAILCIGTILCACGGKQATRQADETVEAAPKAPVIIETNHLNPGVQYTEERGISPASPPVILDFTAKLPTQPFALKNHFSKVTCVTLKSPLSPEQGTFL